MHRLLASFIGITATLFSHAAYADCPQGMPTSSAATKSCSQNGMDCAYWEPPTNNPGTQYPLVIFLHGAGSVGTGNHLAPVDDGWTCQLQAVLANQATHPSYIMVPRAPNSEYDGTEMPPAAYVTWNWGNTDSYNVDTLPESTTLAEARRMLKALQQQHPNIDPDRIYVMGVSMGGYGAWDMIARTPELFAAGVPADGGGSPQAAERLKNMAVWAFHNAGDGIVPEASDRTMFEAIAKAGGRPYYTEGARGDHYGMSRPGDMDFVPWLFAQRRGVPSTPVPQLTFSPDGGSQLVGPVTVTITTTPAASEIRYTTNGTIPSVLQMVGEIYTGPFTVDASSFVIAAAHAGSGHQEATTFHSAPFQLGNTPLPGNVTPGGATGGSGSGGASTGGSVAPNPGNTGGLSSAAGGAGNTPSPTSGGATASSGTGGAATSNGNLGSVKSGGCGVAHSPSPSQALGWLGLGALALAAWRRRG